MLAAAARGALRLPVPKRSTVCVPLARTLCSTTAVAPLAAQGAPSALDRRVEEGLQARLDDMESAALVDTPHADRMEALGGQIADELLRAGLQFQDTVVGGGAAATVGEWARVHVVGTLQDGTVFEDTHKSGTPIAFQVGSGQVVLGLDGGLAGMRVGGTRELHLPPHLAYGYRRVGDIPANSDLTFSVTLVQVGEAAAKPEQTLWEAVKDVFR